MLAAQVIKVETSPWVDPDSIVKVKDESTKFCLDYSELNKRMKTNMFPLTKD